MLRALGSQDGDGLVPTGNRAAQRVRGGIGLGVQAASRSPVGHDTENSFLAFFLQAPKSQGGFCFALPGGARMITRLAGTVVAHQYRGEASTALPPARWLRTRTMGSKMHARPSPGEERSTAAD